MNVSSTSMSVTQAQAEIEDLMAQMGQERFDEKHNSSTDTPNTPTKRRLIQYLVANMFPVLDQWRERARQANKRGKAGPGYAYYKLFGRMSSKKLAFITARVIMGCLGGTCTVRRMSLAVSKELLQEMNFARLRDVDAGAYWELLKNTDYANRSRRKRYLSFSLNNAGLEVLSWDVGTRMAVGQILTEAFVEATSLFSRETVRMKNPKGGCHEAGTAPYAAGQRV